MLIQNKISKSNFTPSQQKAFDGIKSIIDDRVNSVLKSTNLEDYIISLSGAAGTGKTYLTAQIANYLKSKNTNNENNNYSFTVTAPTHKAVGVISNMLSNEKIYVKCQTIHAFLGIKPFVDYNTGVERFTVDKTKKTKESTSILIVDESSMIGSDLYEYILEAIEEQRVSLVLFIGDPYQLLPVDKSENEIFNLKYNFQLHEIVRQAKNSYIINIASKLRERIKNKNFIPLTQFFKDNFEKEIEFFHNKEQFINHFHSEEEWYDKNKIIATYKNKDVDAFNKIIRNQFWNEKGNSNPSSLLKGDKLRFKETYSVGELTMYHNGQEILLDDAVLKYHDDLEIQYWECRSVNTKEQQTFRVVDPTSLYTYNNKLQKIAKQAKMAYKQEKIKLWKVFYAIKEMFADIQYIHSSTIHKLQGSTYHTAYIDLFALANNHYMSKEEKYRLTYVAITRASKDIKIFISAFNNLNSYANSIDNTEIDIVKKHQECDSLIREILVKY